ncbi:MAG: metallophosphoesterase [Acetobacteraceae bacterium]
MPNRNLFAISDLHVNYRENREIAEALVPDTPNDWLLVVGDVAHQVEEIEAVLRRLRSRFNTVLFTPGNHDLWSRSDDGVNLRGAYRYRHLVDICRRLDVLTPEDPYPIWRDGQGDVAVAPLFLLYDYTLRPDHMTKEDAMAAARAASVVCSDELLLAADPYPSREAWCRDRLAYTRSRLDALPPGLRTVLAAHWPLHPGPVGRLRYPAFSPWCGTRATADWHVRYRAVASVHGHLHIPITESYDGVRHEEVSLGYPRERRARTRPVHYGLRRILPESTPKPA